MKRYFVIIVAFAFVASAMAQNTVTEKLEEKGPQL